MVYRKNIAVGIFLSVFFELWTLVTRGLLLFLAEAVDSVDNRELEYRASSWLVCTSRGEPISGYGDRWALGSDMSRPKFPRETTRIW